MSKWSCEDEKRFQVALLCYPEDFSNRWEKIAEVVGFSKEMVYQRYQILQIELGQVSPPQYTNSNTNNQPHENNKVSSWTYEEHVLFLLGEQKYGKGHWKNISEKAVGTRNATQVASHAQKFYIRQREKETIVHNRRSIHDFTLANSPPEYLKYLLSPRPHLMLGSCMIMQQPNTSIHRHLALHNDHHSLPVTQLGTQLRSTLYQSHQDSLPAHYDHVGIGGKAEDLSSIRGNTHPGVSDEVMDEKDMNVNDIFDNEQGNTTAGSSPSQKEDLKSGNTHISTDEITGRSPVPPNKALLGASGIYTEDMDKQEDNEVHMDDHECGNINADNSPPQPNSDDCGNPHLAVDDDNRQSPDTLNMAGPGASANASLGSRQVVVKILDSDDDVYCKWNFEWKGSKL